MSQLLPSYLLFSYGKYFFRMRIPKELQPILKKKELKRAIPTTDRRVAERAAIVYAADALEKFANLHSGVVMSDNPLQNMSTWKTRIMPDGVVEHEFNPERLEEEIDLAIRKGIIKPVSAAAGASVAQPSPPIQMTPQASSQTLPPPSQPHVTHQSATVAPQAPSPANTGTLSPDMLLSEAVEFYLTDMRSVHSSKTEEDEKPYRSLYRKLIECIGDLPINQIEYSHAGLFRETLKRMPKVHTTLKRSTMTIWELIEDVERVRALLCDFYVITKDPRSKKCAHKRTYAAALKNADRILEELKSLAPVRELARIEALQSVASTSLEAVKAIVQLEADKKLTVCSRFQTSATLLSHETAGQRLNTCSSLFNRLRELSNGKINNPFYKVTIAKSKNSRNSRLHFNSEDLTKIFSDSIWTSHEYEQIYEYWLPLLLLYSGARINELCQLEKKDVFQTKQGIWCISINDQPTDDEEDIWQIIDKSVKTPSSVRTFPLHPKLLELGFLDFWKSCSGSRLFNIKLHGKKTRLSAYPGRRFNEAILPRVEVKEPRKVFYSFRHTTMDTLKQNLVHMEIRAQLAGHATGSVTGDVYGDEFQASTLLPVLLLLDYDAELSNVKPWVPNPTTPDYFSHLQNISASFRQLQRSIFSLPYVATAVTSRLIS